MVGCPLRAGVDVRPPRDAARVFEKYALRDTKSNTCSINDGCVGQTMVKNEHVFDRTHVRTPDPGPGHGNNRGNTQGMKGSAMTSPTSSTFRSSPTHTALKTREPRISSGARSATRAPDVRPSPRRVVNAGNHGAVRLTRRGRFVAFSASLAALGTIIVGAGQVAGASAQTEGVQYSTVVVQAGETLWGIARDVAPGSDPRGVVQQIRDLNELGTEPIVVGQSIIVPTAR